MAEIKHCADCGAWLPAGYPRGLCARCALESLDASPAEGTRVVLQDVSAVPHALTLEAGGAGFEPGIRRFGDYELLEEIARGGMGIVYRARQVSLDRVVAVKMILDGARAGREFVQRFRSEAAATAVLQHPNIVGIHDVGIHEGQHYFSMDYVAGQNLADVVGQRPLAPKRAARYVRCIAEAIHYAHERGILHRDLKPSNILIDTDDQPRITDFGLAKRLDADSSLTLSGAVLGSPSFMPPEQAVGRRGAVGRASDVYALGGILYFALTGRAPFQAETLPEVIAQVSNVEPIAPRSLNPSVPRDLETICLKCLQKSPGQRYQTARDLADELEAFLRDGPIQSRPVSRPERVWRWCCREPALASLLALVVIVGLLGLAGIVWQWRRAERHALFEAQQRRRAEAQVYMSSMNLAQAAWEADNVSRVAQLLRDTAASSDRGFEWFYWQRQLQRELLGLHGHDTSVLAVAYSFDGHRIVTGGADGTARVWNSATGQQLFALKGHGGPVSSVAFSRDGRRILTASWDHAARLWDARPDAPLPIVMSHPGEVLSAALSPDGERVATGGSDGAVRIWSCDAGAPLGSIEGLGCRIWSVAFSPDGRRLAGGGWDGTVRVWEAQTEALLHTFRGHAGAVFSVAFSPDGQRLASAGRDHIVRLWESGRGTPALTFEGHSASLAAVVFSADGRWIATVGDDQTARVWDSSSGEQRLNIKGHGSRLSAVAFSPDGSRLATAGGCVMASPGAQFIEVGPGDNTVKIWSTDDTGEVLTFAGHTDAVWSLAFSADGQALASASFDGTVQIRDVRNGTIVRRLVDHGAKVRAIAFAPGGRQLVTAGWGGTARLWGEADDEKPVMTFTGHTAELYSAGYAPDGRRLITGSWDGTARLWNTVTGNTLLTLPGHEGGVFPAVFSPEGNRVLTGDGKGVCRIWDTLTGVCVATFRAHVDVVRSAAFSPDGQVIATVGDDRMAKLWEAGSGRLLTNLDGHTAKVMAVVFSPDGQRVLTGSFDQTVKLWASGSGRELLTFKHQQAVLAVAFSPDGKRIVSGSGDGLIRMWEAAVR